jgi:XTP/dITP diphosphohydrolase
VAARIESLREHPEVSLPPESGESYGENALRKARAVQAALGLPALGDDSGIEVDALGGAPGIRSARYAGPAAGDAENNARLLSALAGRSGGERSARFRCVLALVRSAGEELVVEGVCEGRILETPAGDRGFGYDPLFVPEGETLTFAQLPAAVKNRISHRARAAAALRAAARSPW